MSTKGSPTNSGESSSPNLPSDWADRLFNPSLDAKFGNAEIAVNEQGGKQSKLETRYDLISPDALERLAHVLWYGEKRYGRDNWKKIPINDHLNHMIHHAYQYLAGDETEDHMGHILARAMMAVDLACNGIDTEVKEGAALSESLYTRDDLEELFHHIGYAGTLLERNFFTRLDYEAEKERVS